jgi:flagellar biosynthesis/type III secretory pathway chaperone
MTFALITAGIALIVYSYKMIRKWQVADLIMQVSDHENQQKVLENGGETAAVVPELTAIHRSIGEQLIDLDQQRLQLETMVVQLKQERDGAKLQSGKRTEETNDKSEKMRWARLHNDVYLLYDQGMTVTDIARFMSKGKGEVQLILDLRVGLAQ